MAAAMCTPHSSWLTLHLLTVTGVLVPRQARDLPSRRGPAAPAAPQNHTADHDKKVALGRAPDTAGHRASTTATCCCPKRSAQRWTAAVPTVAMIMTTAPGSSDDVAGSSPNRTPSTCEASRHEDKYLGAASCLRDGGRGLYAVVGRDAARPGSMSYAATSCPARATLPAIGRPIAPRPIPTYWLIDHPFSQHHACPGQ